MMSAASCLIRVVVGLLVGLAFGARVRVRTQDNDGSAANNSDTMSNTMFPNGFIPFEAGNSLAILISINLCKKYNAVASAIAKACSLAQVELWIATSFNMTCAFDEAQAVDQNFLPTYIEAPGAETALFVRDFAPTMTVDLQARQPLNTLSMPYFKGYASFTEAILQYLHTRFNQMSHIQARGFASEWGALVTNGEGLCFVGSFQSGQAAMMGHWLYSKGICRKVVGIQGIDIGTGHADIAMAMAGPAQFLISTAFPGTPEPPGVPKNMKTLMKIMKQINGGEGWALPFTGVQVSGDLSPSTYANALVVTGPGGTYVVFPKYDSKYLDPGDLEDPDNEHVKARTAAKESWIAALRSSLGVPNVGIIEVDAGDLFEMKGSIHCAAKNYPAPGFIETRRSKPRSKL